MNGNCFKESVNSLFIILSLNCPFSPRVTLSPPNQRWIRKLSLACIIHDTDLNSPLFPSLPLLHCSSVTATPPLHFLSLSLSVLPPAVLLLKVNLTHKTVWFLFSLCSLCNFHIPCSSPVYQDLTWCSHLYAGWVFPRLPQRH